MKLVLEIPPNITDLNQLIALINDRIRDLNDAFTQFVLDPADQNVDIGKNRIINLADPKNDLDGVNLRSLKQFKTGDVPPTAEISLGIDAYAIVFSKDGQVQDGDQAPGYGVANERKGKPVALWVMSIVAPVTDYHGNVRIDINDGNGPLNVLTADIVLPAGQTGMIISRPLDYAPLMPELSKVTMVNTLGGNAGGLSMGLVVKRVK